MTLTRFGNLLREERVRRGYTVEEIASKLKITSRVVRAIEDADMNSMPHAVYARGFIRSYAQLLGIDEEEIRPVCAALRDANEEPEPDTPIIPPSSHRPAKKSSGGVWITLLLLGLIAGGGWYYREMLPIEPVLALFDRSDEQQPVMAAPSKQPAAPTTATPAPSSTASIPAEPKQPQKPQPSVEQPSSTVVQTAQAAVPTPAVTLPPVPSASNAEAIPQPTSENRLTLQTGSGGAIPLSVPAEGRNHQIILTALSECWVHSTADGTETRQLSIKKGETFALSFDRKLIVKLGNAGGVRIKYDGKELPPAGKPGQVKTLTFPPSPDTQN